MGLYILLVEGLGWLEELCDCQKFVVMVYCDGSRLLELPAKVTDQVSMLQV